MLALFDMIVYTENPKQLTKYRTNKASVSCYQHTHTHTHAHFFPMYWQQLEKVDALYVNYLGCKFKKKIFFKVPSQK